MKSIKLYIILISVLSFVSPVKAQIKQYLKSIPRDFEVKYFQRKHEFNPLHVGDIWQYYFEDSSPPYMYAATRIVQDSIINGKRYFKKIYWWYDLNPQKSNFVSWERNDSMTDNSYMLDFEDVNNNGNTSEELPLDSLDLPYYTWYKSYKYSYPGSDLYCGEKDALLYDSTWAIMWSGDTVLVKIVQYAQLYLTEYIADGYGIIAFDRESPLYSLVGAVINGRKYGTIVSIKNEHPISSSEYMLENNYPNPFNPSTTIFYYLPRAGRIKLKVFDILGREISILVNEEQKPGAYSVIFHGDNFSSGVYIYTLITESKIITKRMLLLK
ncbi:MAG: T9SS type A sorting domain-containing protein [Bacteroidota bacterium]